jgi:murein DD-endopeptidase MepM/ murein hydrolase activator NlpD
MTLLCSRTAFAAAAAVALAACSRGPAPRPAPTPAPAVASPTPLAGEDAARLRARGLAVPVVGVYPDQIPDTFNAGRSGGRTHNAVDILAPRGTPVLSADDGRVARLGSNALGGITVYAVDPDRRFVYYYAHLDRYRAGLAEGMPLAKGEVIGYVGTTGNAPPGTPHLHFQVMRVGDGRRWWAGTPVDPRPYFVTGGIER